MSEYSDNSDNLNKVYSTLGSNKNVESGNKQEQSVQVEYTNSTTIQFVYTSTNEKKFQECLDKIVRNHYPRKSLHSEEMGVTIPTPEK